MAVLTVVGLMSLHWMAALSVLILTEKNWSRGPSLARIVDVAMIGGGMLVAL